MGTIAPQRKDTFSLRMHDVWFTGLGGKRCVDSVWRMQTTVSTAVSHDIIDCGCQRTKKCISGHALTSFAIRRKLLQLFDYFGHFNITLITGYLAGITP